MAETFSRFPVAIERGEGATLYDTEGKAYVDFGAGIVLHKNKGDRVEAGEAIATLYADSAEKCAEAEKRLHAAFTFGAEPPAEQPLVLERIE